MVSCRICPYYLERMPTFVHILRQASECNYSDSCRYYNLALTELSLYHHRHHPDRNNGSAKSTEKFKVISQAYTILSDTTSRKNYDATLKCPSMSVSAAKSSSSPERHPASPKGSDPFSTSNAVVTFVFIILKSEVLTIC